ncbi:MAG: ATP-binding protein [Bacilli bacterium]|nr:ATP-binding protein [Bacilli bacterium]
MKWNVIVNLTSFTCCLIFLIFLFSVYFSKKNMNNYENKIYRRMLVITFLYISDVVIEDIIIILYNYNIINLTQTAFFVISKPGMVCIGLWFVYLAYYIYYVTHENKEGFIADFNNNKKYKHIMNIIIVLCTIWLFFEKADFNLANGMEKTILLSFNVISIFSIFIDFLLVISNYRIINKKKILPIIIIFPLLSLGWMYSIISIIFSSTQFENYVIFFGMIMTLIDFLMFHTIENPDLKVITELTLARDQAEKASNVKSEFLSSMSHELRTPLNAIVGLADISIDNYNVDEIHNDLRDIKNSSLKLLDLVDGILLSNNIDNNTIEVNNSNYNIKELIDSIIHSTKVLIGEKNIQFKTMIDESIPSTLYGDREKVKVILNNLLSNSVKYTDEGYIELSISSLINKDKCNLRITVSDTGKGIKAEDKDKVYDKFYRSEENKDSDIEGTGLGLSITKSLVELLDGSITVNSSEGNGTTFLINIIQKLPVDSSDTEIL